MKRSVLFALMGCGLFVFAMLYSYINAQNNVTRLRLEIPVLAAEVKALHEENIRLHYEMDLFKSPENLIKLSLRNEFAGLKYPMDAEVMVIARATSLEIEDVTTLSKAASSFKTPLATIR